MTERHAPQDPADDDAFLGPYFAAARDPAPPSSAWTARVLADANRETQRRAAPRRAAVARGRRIFDVLGGWAGLGALAAAACAGLTIGLAPLAQIPDPLEIWIGAAAGYDLLPVTGDEILLALDGG
ncbi:MAG: hypothetical protein NXH82_03425 [Rhodobacteraceae bacterium]|nr:hypothetical protein [Paracoccaceae bacterium]